MQSAGPHCTRRFVDTLESYLDGTVRQAAYRDQDVIPSVDSWLKGLCSRPLCSNDNIATVVQTLVDGCSADLGQFGLSNIDAGELTTLVQQIYPTAREAACLAE